MSDPIAYSAIPNGTDGAPNDGGNVDKIRDILFGSQMRDYDRRFASGVIAASGTLAQIIPPSLVLIIMADQ